MATATGEELVRWTERDFPGRTPSTRAAHTVGIGAAGTFTPSTAVARYTVAPQFNDGPHDVLVRFSNGSGLDQERDLHTDARGLAIKFFHGTARETDLVAMTLPVFFVKTGKAFDAFSKASVPVDVSELRTTWWQRFKLSLQLKQPPAPPPDDVKIAIDPSHLTAFAREHQEAKTGVAALSTLINPVSYSRATYHGVHSFLATGPNGLVRPVRFQWEPFLGVRGISPEQRKTLANDHLHTDLRRRLDHGTISFTLNLLIGEQGDAVDDPTTVWPVERSRISAGILTLDRMVEDQVADCDKLSFNPGRVLKGFAMSDDDLLHSRKLAYEYSCQHRSGSGCPVMP